MGNRDTGPLVTGLGTHCPLPGSCSCSPPSCASPVCGGCTEQSGHPVTPATRLFSHAVIFQGLLGPIVRPSMSGRSGILFTPCNNSQRGHSCFADGETEAGRQIQSLSSTSLASSHNSLPSPIYFVFSHYSFPAKWYKKSSGHWRQSGIRAYQMEPTHLPLRSPTWGHLRPRSPSSASISQMPRATLLDWDQIFSTSLQSPWPRHFWDR